jgi:hypothetical protein
VETFVGVDAELQPWVLGMSFQVMWEIVLFAVGDSRTSKVRVLVTPAGSEIEIAVAWDATSTDDFFLLRERVWETGGAFRQERTADSTRVIASLPLAS